MNATIINIDANKATEYLKFNTVNRPLNQAHVAFLASEMINGNWKLNGEAICFENGKLVNGQHRLNAIIIADVKIDMLVVSECEVGSFKTFDSGRNRTISEVFSIIGIPYAALISSIIGRYKRISIQAKEGKVNVGRSLTGAKKQSKIELEKEYNSTPELYQSIAKFSFPMGQKHILTGVEIGGYVSFLIKDKKHPNEFVMSFFEMLSRGKNISNTTIELLRDRLLDDKLSNAKLTPKYKQMLIIKAWNCYVKDVNLKTLRWNETSEGELSFI